MRFNSGFWRKCRIALRCLRFAVWAAVLVVLGACAWFNVVGLPDFVKSPLVTALRERGVPLEFSRMRLRFVRGFVAENVRLGDARNPDKPLLTASEVQLRLDYAALWHGNFHLAGAVLRNGKFTLPLSPTNSLALFNLQTDLSFQPDGTWSLDRFTTDFAGVRIKLAAEVAHATTARKWQLFSGRQSASHGSIAGPLQQFSDTLRALKFRGRPEINATLSGDARDVHSFTLRLNARVPDVQSPWFGGQNLQLAASLTAPTNVPATDETWGLWASLQPFRLAWTARAAAVRSEIINVEALELTGLWQAPELALTKISAQLGGGTMSATARLNVATRLAIFTNDSAFDLHAVSKVLTPKTRERLAEIAWTQPPLLAASGSLRLPPWTNGVADWREDIEPTVQLAGALAFTNAVAGGAALDSVRTHFSYGNLIWRLPDLELAQGRTKLRLSAEESEATKNFAGHLSGMFDAASVRPFLTASNAVRGFGHLAFNAPVALDLDVSGNLRDFGLLAASGRVALTNAAIRGQTVEWLTTAVAYSNLTAEFSQPRLSRADGAQNFSAEKVTLDVNAQTIFITGGEGRIEPMVVGRSIGPKTARAMEPYQFLSVPTTRVSGCIPIKQVDGEVVTDAADLRVDIVGDVPFRWRRFETPAITGTIHWWKNYLIITNATTECYTGTAQGWGVFDVRTEGVGTDFSFFITGTNVDFHRMGQALWSPTNTLEGSLSGTVNVTRANSEDWRTWNGFGSGKLRDGMLWDVPVIGLVSPALNLIVPGIGNSRATQAAGNFTMTNGVIFTDTLVIRSLTMRLDYVGTVDLEQKVNARVTAQLLRNTPLVGSLVSTVLWPVSKVFECSVTGTLGEPKPTPLYVIPKLLLVPLHPIRSMEGIFAPPPKGK